MSPFNPFVNAILKRWTLDFPEDYEFVRAIFEALYPANPNFGMWEVIEFLEVHPELRNLNAMHRNFRPADLRGSEDRIIRGAPRR